MFNDNGLEAPRSLSVCRRSALRQLLCAAYDAGGNAVINVQYHYLKFEPETIDSIGSTHFYQPYLICVTACGDAVIVENE